MLDISNIILCAAVTAILLISIKAIVDMWEGSTND